MMGGDQLFWIAEGGFASLCVGAVWLMQRQYRAFETRWQSHLDRTLKELDKCVDGKDKIMAMLTRLIDKEHPPPPG